MENSSKSNWVGSVVGIVALVGTGVGVYTNLVSQINTNAAAISEKIKQYDKSMNALDRYQAQLQVAQDAQESRITKLEVRYEIADRQQAELVSSMKELSTNIQLMREALITIKMEKGDKSGD